MVDKSVSSSENAVSPQDRKREIGEELAALLTEYNDACDDCSPPTTRERLAARILELTHELDGHLAATAAGVPAPAAAP